MQVSRNSLQTYPDLSGRDNPNYFTTRAERNAAFGTSTITAGQYCAIGGDPNSDDWNIAVWTVEQYNGTNWAIVDIDTNFALIVTNSGLQALSNAQQGQYKLEISRIALRQTGVGINADIINWTNSDFLYGAPNQYADVCLDTANINNTTFTLANNLSWRTNLLNGGIQFTVTLDVDTMGQTGEGSIPILSDFNVSMIALFVKNQNSAEHEDVLFAVANLPATIKKLASTPYRIGNSLKFYLNTTLTNLGSVVDVSIITDSVNSVPEVTEENHLPEYYDGVSSPYNLYLVDNYGGTNLPALAARGGNPVDTENPINWVFFTPVDNQVKVDGEVLSGDLIDYMVAAWDSDTNRYVPADGNLPLSNSQHLAGIYSNQYIIYNGKVSNINVVYTYQYQMDTSAAQDYLVGEVLTANIPIEGTAEYVPVTIQIQEVNDSGTPIRYTVTPQSGNLELSTGQAYVVTAYKYPEQAGLGTGLMIKASFILNAGLVWNFPSNWVNRPLFADTGANAGKLTTTETEMFVGWCLDPNTISLALDLRNEATESDYGTTRYASNAAVSDVTEYSFDATGTSVTPKTLQDNYIQKTNVTGNPGDAANNPITVYTHLKFNETVYGKGSTYQSGDLSEVSFYGTAYRALWQDLAEYYESDRLYPAGTLICIGSGTAQITEAKVECNGIISTKPGYELGTKRNAFDLPVALVGKVPVLFAQDCVPHFGDRVYLSKTMPGKASTIPYGKCLGKIIDKRDHLDQVNTVECSIRISF